jgi:hypothetical protein
VILVFEGQHGYELVMLKYANHADVSSASSSRWGRLPSAQPESTAALVTVMPWLTDTLESWLGPGRTCYYLSRRPFAVGPSLGRDVQITSDFMNQE